MTSVTSANKAASLYQELVKVRHMKWLIVCLSSFGCWPYKIMGEKRWFSKYTQSHIAFTELFIAGCLCLSYLIKHFSTFTFFDLGHLFIDMAIASVSLQRLTVSWTSAYKDVIKRFFREIHLIYYRHESEYALKIYHKVENVLTKAIYVIFVEVYFGTVLFNITPIYNSYKRGMFKNEKPANVTFDLSCFYDLPFNYTTELKGYIIVFIINSFVTVTAASCIILFDFYISTIILNLWGHLKILQHNLSEFPKPSMENSTYSLYSTPWYNDEESNVITDLLIKNIKHHKVIQEFIKKVSNAFSLTVCYYLLFHQMAGCLMLVEVAQMKAEALATYGLLAITSFQQLMQMSIVFELLATESDNLIQAVYAIPWECMNTKNRKIVLFFLCNVQTPMNFKAMGMIPVGVQTMASILKTSISYFMLLRSTAADK